MSDLTGYIDKFVNLRGTAMDAHAGAVLLLSDEEVVYLDGMDSWDEELAGEELAVSGVLRQRKLGPAPTVDSEGRLSHGIDGTQLVLEGAKWTPIA